MANDNRQEGHKTPGQAFRIGGNAQPRNGCLLTKLCDLSSRVNKNTPDGHLTALPVAPGGKWLTLFLIHVEAYLISCAPGDL